MWRVEADRGGEKWAPALAVTDHSSTGRGMSAYLRLRPDLLRRRERRLVHRSQLMQCNKAHGEWFGKSVNDLVGNGSSPGGKSGRIPWRR